MGKTYIHSGVRYMSPKISNFAYGTQSNNHYLFIGSMLFTALYLVGATRHNSKTDEIYN